MATGAGVVLSLVGARLRVAGRRWALLVAAIGLGTLLPVVSDAVSTVTGDATLRRGIEDLPVAARSVTILTSRAVRGRREPELEPRATELLARLSNIAPLALMMFRPITDNAGGTIQLGAIDGLADRVEIVDGRLPISCRPERCEVVRLADWPGTARPEGLDGVEVVGTVRATDRLLRSGAFEVVDNASVLLTEGVEKLDGLDALQRFGRYFAWVTPLDIERIRSQGIDSWAATAIGVSADATASPGILSLVAPDADLLRDVFRARLSAARFRTLGAAMAALMLGGAIVGGAALRADHRSFVAVLRRRGMSPRARAAVIVGETAAIVGVGVAVGLAAGAGVAYVLGRRADLDAGWVAARAVEQQGWRPFAFGVIAVALVVATLCAPPGRRGSSAAWRAVEAAFAVVAMMTAVVVGRGGVGNGLTTVRSDPVLAALPVLILLLGGLLTARLWPVVVRAVARVTPRRAVATRLGVTGAAGRPLRPIVSSALVAAAIGATLFATAYRATLARGAVDQSAEQVPLDQRLTAGPALDRPLDLVTPDVAASLGVDGYPVLRLAASLRVASAQGVAIETIGVDRSMLADVERWTAVVGGSSGAEVAAALDPGALPTGPVLPPGRELVIDAAGPQIVHDVTAILRTDDGRVRGVELRLDPEGGAPAPAPQRLVGELPVLDGASGGAHLVTLITSLSEAAATDRQHNLGEGDLDRASPVGTIHLGGVTVDGTALPQPWKGWSGVTAAADGSTAVFDYVLAASGAIASARSLDPGTAEPLPVAVDRLTARAAGGLGGELQLIVSQQPVPAIVAAVLPRFPTVGDRFAVVDLAALERVSDVTAPGSGQPGELWVRTAPGVDLASRFPTLEVADRVEIRERLRSDPVARSASGLLAAAAGLTLLLALVVVVLVVATERHDDAPQLTAWEADGVSPRILRRSLFWRTVAVVVPALPAGALAGAVLTRLTARLVAVTATATVPRPPLAPFAGLATGCLVAVAALVAALAVAWIVAARSLREPLPPRLMGSGQ